MNMVVRELLRELWRVPYALTTTITEDPWGYLSWPMKITTVCLGYLLRGLRWVVVIYAALFFLAVFPPPGRPLAAMLAALVMLWIVGVGLLLKAGLTVERKNQHNLRE
ncbi:MAG: hypothetical protein WD200_02810 [Candidatus Andersenbacteria bacterium]